MTALNAALAALLAYSLAFGTRGPLKIPPWTAAFLFSAAALAQSWLDARRSGRALLDGPAYRPLFWLLMSVYLSTFRWHGGDDIPNSILPWAVFRHGTVSLEPLRSWFLVDQSLQDFVVQPTGTLLSIFSIIPGLIALPVSAPAVLFGAEPEPQLLHNLSKLSGSLIAAASVVVFYAAVRTRASERWSAVLALAFGLGGWSFSVSSQALHSHGPAQLGTALGFWGLLSGRAFLGGLGFSLALSCREDTVFFAAAAGLFILAHRRREFPLFFTGALIPAAVNAVYWLWFTNRLTPPYLGTQTGLFVGLQPEALASLLIGPTRGIFWFSPVAALGGWALWRGLGDPRRRWIPYFTAASVAGMILISCRTTWAGGQTFGNRYFSISLMVFLLALADEEETIRKSSTLLTLWSAAFGISIIIHSLGGYFLYPGSFETERQIAEAWTIALHPAIDLFRENGSLGALGIGRFAAGTAILTLALPLAVWSSRFLSPKSSKTPR